MPCRIMSRRSRIFSGLLPLVMGLVMSTVGSTEVRAQGMTTHELISYMVQKNVSDAKLKSLLDHNQDAYRNGTLFPDIAQEHLKKKWTPGSGGHSRDDLSHGQQDGKPEGIINEYLKVLQKECGNVAKGEGNKDCQEAMAFWLGMISHNVADGPWHADFIGLARTGTKASTKDHCKSDNDDRHHFADNDLDICIAKMINNAPLKSGGYYYQKNKEATRERKNKYVAQGCPKDQWWHVGGGDGLLGACFSCPDGYEHDLSKLPNKSGVCYQRKVVHCEELEVDKLGIDVTALRLKGVTANILGFSRPSEAGNRFAAMAYNNLNSQPKNLGVGKATSKEGLIKVTDGFLDRLWKEQHAGPTDFSDNSYGCRWGLQNAVTANGGVNDSAEAAADFIAKSWKHLKNGEDFEVVRLGAYNYGILYEGKIEHCVTSDKSKGCP